ncbi:hypothetical protein K501DRAFT_246252 [Backusella circina FSU 941]|nr:hypothetical protein K501DRAFT_246252 [Backusella circina FSU 941]
MTNNARSKKSKRVRKTDKKNKSAIVKPDLPKPIFSRKPLVPKNEEEQSDNEMEEVEFERPENHYMHYTEPEEKVLFEKVEYDMDEQDLQYLQRLNQRRQREGLSNINEYTFESVIDRLEKEWYNLIKDMPNDTIIDGQSIGDAYTEEVPCVICNDSDVENANAMVFCDGCNLAVHQDCYGIPHIPEGQWLCRKCTISPQKPVTCIFCPNEGGAFKQIKNRPDQWGHLLCAFWIPEVGVSDTVLMEPIDPIDVIPPSRRQLTCFICNKKRHGACIQCDYSTCYTAFHPSCARLAKLYMRMVPTDDDIDMSAYCDRHTPEDYEYDAEALVESIASVQSQQKKSVSTIGDEKAARAYQHQYTMDIPVAPDGMLAKLDSLETLKKYRGKQKAQVVTDLARYWSLKRESRRGTTLNKRLQIEPWNVPSAPQNEIDPSDRYNAALNLRLDLEKVRILAERTKRREKFKLDKCRLQADYIEGILFPMDTILLKYLDEFMDLDKEEVFITPPGNHVDPDSLTAIYSNVREHVYQNIEEFIQAVTDVWEHIINNPASYKKKSREMKTAQKLKKAAPDIFSKARAEWDSMILRDDTNCLDMGIDPTIFDIEKQVPTKQLKENVPPAPPTRRATRSGGLEISIHELVNKKSKMSSEAKQLYESYIGASALTRVAPTYREDKKRRGGPGWAYAESDDDDDDNEEEDVPVAKRQKRTF